MRIVADKVSVTVRRLQIVRPVSFAIEDRCMTALVGPSGSGKTTILTLCAGYVKPTDGRLQIYENGVQSDPSPDLVAWVPQGNQALPTRSVLDNVMIGALAEGAGRERARVIAEAALERLNLRHLLHRRSNTISGGELQRVAIARALATSRSILLIDEPTANLDRASASEVADALANVGDVRTIVIATHDQMIEGIASATIRLG